MDTKVIADVLKNNLNKDWLLPSMQREFVWKRKENKIEKLFDSIMQGYPFGSILTWEVSKDKVDKIELYEFVQDFNEDSPHNLQPSINQYAKYNLVLDGQQRLSALNIGLQGSYSYSQHRRLRKTLLYLNLLSQIYSDIDNTYGIKYEFKFFSEKDVPLNSIEDFWISVGDIWHVYNDVEISDDDKKTRFVNSYKKKLSELYLSDEKKQLADSVLQRLYERICEAKLLNIDSTSTKDDEMVLNIFVRTNDGGMRLEKSDLLLAYMESNKQLFQPNGARKEVQAFVATLNLEKLHKPEFDFSKDDVLKASLVMSGLDVKYRLSNFNSKNLETISNIWSDIRNYLEMTINLVSRYGFSKNNIISKNSIIPIAYYLFKKKLGNDFVESNTNQDVEVKNDLIRWLAISQLTGLFGSSSDSTLQSARTYIDENKGFAPGNAVTREEVEGWIVGEKYGSRYSHLVLMLVTSNKYWDRCHQDHIFPRSKFELEHYSKLELTQEQIVFYEKYADSIMNLHLLNPFVNIHKSDEDFIDWGIGQNKEFLGASLIPHDISYNFKDFQNFILKRKELLSIKLCEILNVK